MPRLGLALLVFLTGCGGSDPGALAEAWTFAYIRGNTTVVDLHAAPELAEKLRRSRSPFGEEFDPLAKPKLTIPHRVVTGDQATIKVRSEDQDTAMVYVLTLSRIDGEWKVTDLEIE